MSQQPWGGQPQQYAQGGYAPQQQFPQQQGNAWGGQQQAGQQQYQGPAPVASVEGDSFDDFFSGGEKGAPGFDFGATQNGGEKQIGAMVMGEIVHMVKQQQRDFATGNPLFFDGGDPRMQVAVTLQTELRNWQGVKPKLIPKDPSDPSGQRPLGPEHDDGKRRVYVKGDMVRAVNQACAAAGGQKPRVGGKLAVRIRGFEPTNKGNDKTLYDAQYVPAPEPVATDTFFGQEQPPQGQAYPPAPAPQGGFAQQAPQYAVQQQGGVLPQAQAPGQPPAAAGQDVQQGFPPAQLPQAQAPQQQYPSTLGNGPAPTAPPEWAGPTGQEGYAPAQQAPAQQPQAPIPSSQYTEPQF